MTDIVDRLLYADMNDGTRRLLDEAADEIERLRRAAGGWLPIETAPRDGAEIVILLGGHAVSSRWLSDEPGYRGSGWLTIESRERFLRAEVPQAWMPLPPPPSGEKT